MLLQNFQLNRFCFHKSITISALCAIALAPVVLDANIANAQPKGMQGSYVGAGLGAGVTDDEVIGGNVQGRLAIPKTPVSLRGAVLFGGDAAAIMPMITVDVPIAKNTNLYLGGGYSFVTDEGDSTQLGDEDSVVLTTGVETGIGRNAVIYGDVKWGIDAYDDSSKDAVSLQLGVGYRF